MPLHLILRNPVNNSKPISTASVRRFRRYWQRALILILPLALMSCATGRPVTPELVRSLPVPPPPPIPAGLMQPCPRLPMPEGETWASLIANHDAVTAHYHLCRAMQRHLIEAVKAWEHTAKRNYCTALQRAEIPVEMCNE